MTSRTHEATLYAILVSIEDRPPTVYGPYTTTATAREQMSITKQIADAGLEALYTVSVRPMIPGPITTTKEII